MTMYQGHISLRYSRNSEANTYLYQVDYFNHTLACGAARSESYFKEKRYINIYYYYYNQDLTRCNYYNN